MREDVENILLLDELGEAAPIYDVDKNGKFLACTAFEDGKPVIRWFEGRSQAFIFMPLTSMEDVRTAVVQCLLEAVVWNTVFEGTTREDLDRLFTKDDHPYSTLSAHGEAPSISLGRDFFHPDVPPGAKLYIGEPEYVGRVAVKKNSGQTSYGVLLFNPKFVVGSRT